MRNLITSVCACFLLAPAALAQQGNPAQPAPLAAMPYSPSLDLASVDRSVDPCADFYRFSCGGWMKNNPIPADQARWDVYSKLANENQQFLWGILEADAKAEARTPTQQKIGDYFAACMDTATIDKLGAAPVRPTLDAIDAMQDRKALIAYLGPLNRHVPGTFFFDAGSTQDPGDSSSVIAEISAGGLGLPDRDYYLKTDPKSEEIRKAYLVYVQRILTLSGEPAAKATEGCSDHPRASRPSLRVHR